MLPHADATGGDVEVRGYRGRLAEPLDDVEVGLVHLETLRPVTFLRKPFLTPRNARFATICRMDESWRQLTEPHERLRWARLRLTEFKRPTDAARSMNMKPGTYRNYELPKASGGKWPDPGTVRRIAKKFNASWSWILTGDGDPTDTQPPEMQVITRELAERVQRIPADKREDALDAAKGVLDAYIRKAG